MAAAAAAVVSPLARSLFRFLLNIYKWICLKWLTLKQNYLYYNNIIGRNNNNTLQLLSQSEKRIQSGEAWDEFCDTLKAAGAVVFAPGVPSDNIHVQAEGYRYLSRLTRAGLENWVECCNVDQPQLCSIANGNRPARICIGSDNPDNLYQHATIDSSLEYEITGTRGTVQYLSFGTQSGSYGSKGGLQTVDLLESNELIYDDNDDKSGDDSKFKILLSASKQQQQSSSSSSSSNLTTTKTKTKNKNLNWLRLNSNIKDALFIVRQTFGDRSNEIPAKLSIRCISSNNNNISSNAPSSSSSSSLSFLTAEKLDNGLQQASIFVAGASSMFAKWSYEFKSNHTNSLPLFDPQRSTNAGGDPNIRYYHSYWDLSNNNKVLRIRFVPPPGIISWNFQLNNHWMESLDYRYHTIHTNSTLAKRDNNNNNNNKGKGDGNNNDGSSYTIIVSEKNPNWDGIFRGNWIETVGHDCGTMCFRWVGTKGIEDHKLPQPHVEVMDFESLLVKMGKK